MLGTLLSEVDANTTGTAVLTDGAEKTLLVDATSFGGGTVTVEVSRASDNSKPWVTYTFVDGSTATYTAAVCRKMEALGFGIYVRAKLTGATGASKVNVQIS